MQVIESIQQTVDVCRKIARPLGLVPTMGALHEGHLALVRQAREENTTLAVSIFVNPSQFGPNEDLARYPTSMARDLDLLRGEGVDLAVTPKPAEVYPSGFSTWSDVGDVATHLEGAFRPGHFRGVATVVTKLFNVVHPDRAYFGQKDGQQIVVIKRLVRDLNMGVQLVVVPTVRDSDGLARSSRNVHLTQGERRAATVVYQSLCKAKEMWERGERDAEVLRLRVMKELKTERLVEDIDYVSVADSETLEELTRCDRPVIVSVAIKVVIPRLIDNIILK